MSMFLYDWENELDSLRPTQLMDQHFGLGLHPHDILSPLTLPSHHRHHHNNGLRRGGYYRPWNLNRADNGSTVKFDRDQCQVNLDVQQFAPEEITVKVADNAVIVEGKHEEKPDDHGYISRTFRRRYTIPQGYNIDGVKSSLSSDGILSITTPKRSAIESNEREIPIAKTGPAKAIVNGQRRDETDERKTEQNHQ